MRPNLTRVWLFFFSVFSLVLAVFLTVSGSHTEDPALSVEGVNRPGKYRAPGGKCQVSLQTSSMGGHLDLRRKAATVAQDVTGIAWASQNILIYTVSPIYGKPGVYALDCKLGRIRRIFGPKTFNKAYPEGADYFELRGLRGSNSGTIIYFYYAEDVDKVDFNRFRIRDFLFQIRLDGKQFKKAQ